MRKWLTGCALALAAGLPGPLAAQHWIALDAGAGTTRHQFATPGGTFSLAPRVIWLGPWARFDVASFYTRGTALGWNAESQGSGAITGRIGPQLAADLGFSGGWSAHQRGAGTGELELLPALRFDAAGGGVTGALGIGRAWTPSGDRAYLRGSLIGRARLGGFDVGGEVTRTQFGIRALRSGVLWIPNGVGQDTLFQRYVTRYDDLSLRLGWSGRRVRIEGSVEQRIGLKEFRAMGWHLEATGQLTRDLALFGAAGRTLSRLTVDLPARGYATAGIRWLLAGPRGAAPAERPKAAMGEFVSQQEGELTRLAIHAPGRSRVEIAADFSDWEPVPMEADGTGWWVVRRRLPPGLYRLNVRFDGGPWQAPPGLPTLEDEFGGSVGIINLP